MRAKYLPSLRKPTSWAKREEDYLAQKPVRSAISDPPFSQRRGRDGCNPGARRESENDESPASFIHKEELTLE